VPESLRNRLRGDLDTIVLKALKKSPTERYPTAGALAEDLRRYVRGDAVSARPDTFWYRLTKRTHRHRSALQGAAVAGLAVAAVAVITNLHDRWMPNRHAPADSAIPARRAPASPATMINAKSVAVLPFLDMSAQKDQQYFADGLTEEMIDLLTKIRDLRVPARTSSFYFKDKQATIAEIARTLGVANLLEGSVRKSGDKLRITAQLIRADSGYHLWSETYDRQLDDVFKVQDEIAGAVVTALKVSLMSGSALESTSSQNSEAYNLYLQGRFIRHRANSKAEYDLCLDYLRRAVQADPTFAAAWAELSIAVSAEAEDGFAPLDSTTAEARHAAQRALALDPALPDAHTATARILIYDGYDINGGEQQISQALALDPNSSWALSWAGELATYRGHFDQAIELRNKALFNDPVNNFRYSDLAYTLYYAGRYAEARGAIRKMLDLNPGAREDRWIAEYALLASGDAAGTLAELDREPDEQLRRGCGCRALALDALGRTGDANAALAYLEKNQTINGAYPIGRVYASRGNLDRAFEWFSRAYRQRDDNLSFAKVDPLLKNVQSDPRFNALLRKIGLLDLHDTAPSSNGS
jgi:TolB-like protein/cytochrome c-type biogenesis protein CcmH/NrfG